MSPDELSVIYKIEKEAEKNIAFCHLIVKKIILAKNSN